MESWDDENFEPDVASGKGAVANKWEGEDEDDDIKESWEDEEEEKEKAAKEENDEKASQKPKKKSLAEKIAEKEKLKQEELEKRRKEAEEDEADVSPEERLRRQKESDLQVALATTFGGGGAGEVDFNTCPTTLAEFDEFANALLKKIQPLTKSSEYPNFAENLVRNVCATLSSFDLKKVKTTIDNLYIEKQKIEKGDKAKKNKGKGKVKLKVEDSNQYSAYAVDDYVDDFDDFM